MEIFCSLQVCLLQLLSNSPIPSMWNCVCLCEAPRLKWMYPFIQYMCKPV